jgi:hypothetical protein
MALCSRCGGGFDFYPLLKRAPVPPIEADPFCPLCGHRRHVTCQMCQGYGFVPGEGRLLRGYCTGCGKLMDVPARLPCPSCHGHGQTEHNCAGRVWPEGAFRPLSARPVVTLVSHSRSRALLRRRA